MLSELQLIDEKDKLSSNDILGKGGDTGLTRDRI